jgi:D-3-phosphoglycerate dehydrogenase
VVKNPYGRRLTEEETIALGKDCVGIVAGVESLNAKVIDALPNLKCISRVGVGMDSVDIPYAESKGIKVVNTPNGPTRAVAELTLGLTMALLRKVPNAHYDLRNKVWKKQTGNLLFEKKVGILGLGRIGRMTAEMFRALGNPVAGYDLFPNEEWATANGVEILDLKELLATCDIITIHVPGKADGSAVITKAELDLLKDDAFLVNVSRGGVIDEEALYHVLKSGKLSAVALDVFSQEPYSGPLCDVENVVLTPHIGSYAKEGKLKMEVDAAMNLINALK